jgi:hypothetical protein
MKLYLALFILVIAGLVGWYFYCPIPLISQFQAAVDENQPDSLQSFLDMDSLQKDITNFVKLRFNQKDNPSGELSPDAVQAIVKTFLTPQNIFLLMKGVQITPGSAINMPPTDDKTPHPIEKHFESPDVYAIDIYQSQVETPDNKVSLLFARNGWFDWKLSAIRFSWGG